MTNRRQRWRKLPPVPHGDGEEFGVFSDFLTPVLQRSTLGFSQSWYILPFQMDSQKPLILNG